jgi:hypothetical protein
MRCKKMARRGVSAKTYRWAVGASVVHRQVGPACSVSTLNHLSSLNQSKQGITKARSCCLLLPLRVPTTQPRPWPTAGSSRVPSAPTIAGFPNPRQAVPFLSSVLCTVRSLRSSLPTCCACACRDRILYRDHIASYSLLRLCPPFGRHNYC